MICYLASVGLALDLQLQGASVGKARQVFSDWREGGLGYAKRDDIVSRVD